MRITRPIVVGTPVVALAATLGAAPAAPAQAETTTEPYSVEATTPKGEAAVEEVTVVLVAPQGLDPDYTPEDVAAELTQTDACIANETDGRVHVHTTSIGDWQVPDDPGVRCDDYASIDASARRAAGHGLERREPPRPEPLGSHGRPACAAEPRARGRAPGSA